MFLFYFMIFLNFLYFWLYSCCSICSQLICLIKCLINLRCSFVNSFCTDTNVYKVKKYSGGYNIFIVAKENFELLATLAKGDFFLTANTGYEIEILCKQNI